MTLYDIKEHVLTQVGEDVEDMDEFDTRLLIYINDGYFTMLDKRMRGMVNDIVQLSSDSDVPNLPEMYHSSIADYATWMMYRNGNPVKQQRGQAYLARFNEALASLPFLDEEETQNALGGRWRMRNLYTH